MRSRPGHRWLRLFAALALLVVAVGQFPAVPVTPMMAAAAADLPQGGCEDCTGDALPAAACDLLCSGTLAVVPEPSPARLATFDAPAHPSAGAGPTRAVAPETGPPRRTVAS